MKKINLNIDVQKVDAVVKRIGKSSYFKSVPEDLLFEIFQFSAIYELKAGEYLIREGDRSDHMVYILLAGEFKVYAANQFILKIDQTGLTIGEMAALAPDMPRSADVKASKDSKVIGFKSSFLEDKDPETQRLINSFLRLISIILTEKLKITTERAKLYEETVLEKREIDRYNKEITDLSRDLKRELQEKLEQIKLYSQVVECNQDAIVISDIDGNLQFGNHAFLQLFAYKKEEIRGLRLMQLFDNLYDDAEDWRSRTKFGWKGQKKASRKNSTSFPALISISPVKTTAEDSKERIVLATVVRDITLQKEYENKILKANQDLKQTYSELESTLQKLEKSNRIKDQFLSNITTQLKTPLDSIINNAEIMHKYADVSSGSIESKYLLAQIFEEGRKMDRLVENLLALAELSPGMSNLSVKAIPLGDFLAEIGSHVSDEKRVEFDIDEDTSFIVGDREKLFKALRNIFDYIHFKYGNKYSILISIKQDCNKNKLAISFAFGELENFERGQEQEAESDDGIEISIQKADLELPLANKIVELHSGSMTIDSREKYERIVIGMPTDPSAEDESRIRAMLIDEHKWDRKIIKGIIEKQFALNDIFEFNSQVSALKAINTLQPNLVIVDPFFQDFRWQYDEFLTKLIKDKGEKMSTLVISDQLVKLPIRNKIISLGITDFQFKPFTIDDAEFKIKLIVETKQRLSLLSSNVKKAKKSAATDAMTGLYNRKHYDEFVQEQFGQAELQEGVVSIIMIDVDNFKHYNDTNGHQEGDEVLKKVASILRKGVRRNDLVARYGGEEFVVVLPGTGKKMAENIAEKLRMVIEKTSFFHEEKQPTGVLTASFGVSAFPENGHSPEVVLKGADHSLYLAKEKGRNLVVGADGIVEL